MKKTKLTFKKIIKLFKYRKNNEKYWNSPKLHKQMVIKALFIAKAFF